ncbi:MAG TPA: response regulator transcription factor, partial [Microbacterium sp.]|nr:response regulator transcription factor [Microbacterium sp.]
MNQPTVLLVDDHATMRAGFRMILEASGVQVAGEAATGREAIDRAAVLDPDVVFMDVQMPDMDGIEATRRIVASGSRASVVIVTTFDRDDYLFAALDA